MTRQWDRPAPGVPSRCRDRARRSRGSELIISGSGNARVERDCVLEAGGVVGLAGTT